MTATTSTTSSTLAWVLGLDAASLTTRAADHLALAMGCALDDVGLSDVVVATHLVPGPGGFSCHLALSVAASGPMPADAVTRLLVDVVVSATPAAPHEVGVAEGARSTGLPLLAAGARHAHTQRRRGHAERVPVFPGHDEARGELTLRWLLAHTDIGAVRVLGGAMADVDAVLRTREHVRPALRDGVLVLEVQPSDGGYVPFESPSPTPCCADH